MADWETRMGSFAVRCSCPECSADLYLQGFQARCTACPDVVVNLCLDTYGTKACVRERGHEGPHLSPSATQWPKIRRDS
jgi:hypothetical protein